VTCKQHVKKEVTETHNALINERPRGSTGEETSSPGCAFNSRCL
jgi:hypothetical protein